jgi:hypothetical protein
MKINTIIQEEIQNLFETELMGLPELAEYLSRTGNDFNVMLDILKQEYYNGGDEAVKEVFKSGTGINIDTIGKGKYVFKY